MFLIAVVVLAVLTVPLAGGRLGALVELRLRRVWAIFLGLGLEVAAIDLPGLSDRMRAAIMVAAYPVLAVFLVANWRLPGMPVVALGGALNLLAIAVNGGVMPASPAALAGAGLDLATPGFQNSAAVDDPRLAFLGDVFYIPASWPLSNVFSVGDVLIALGVAWAVHGICGSRLVPSRAGSELESRPGD
ncbi:MAG TPA: DUF5317 domain-containing protein [Actinomycetota bacterium]|nr:DUF5317 domain-containing protein [Actinomycetota bacterium]